MRIYVTVQYFLSDTEAWEAMGGSEVWGADVAMMVCGSDRLGREKTHGVFRRRRVTGKSLVLA